MEFTVRQPALQRELEVLQGVVERKNTVPILGNVLLSADQEGLELCETAYGALNGAHALAIITEWQEFRSPDFSLLKEKLNDEVVFDGRNLYEPQMLEHLGLKYFAIGRGSSVVNTAVNHSRRKTDM